MDKSGLVGTKERGGACGCVGDTDVAVHGLSTANLKAGLIVMIGQSVIFPPFSPVIT